MVSENPTYRTILIGSGFSGICMAIRLLEKGITNFVILEKAKDLGGTWRENTYPGAECDIPSALYSYSFEPYPDWEYKWSHQPQILKYIKHCSLKYKVDEHILYNQQVERVTWNEDHSNWKITTSEGQEYHGNSLISAIGQLHYPSFPDIEGKDSFNGESWHSAQWDHSKELNGKRVGVIGNAASAIQFIPEIADQVSSLSIFQRSPNWMLPKQDRLYKDWEKDLVKKFPFILKLYRLKIWLLGGGLFFLMKDGNGLLRRMYQEKSIKHIKHHIKDKELVDKLTPSFPMGAKRVLFSDNYYDALSKSQVHLLTDPIKCITPDGIQTKNDKLVKLDIIIYATGFKTNPFFQHIKIKGKNNLGLHEAWKKAPSAYLGISVSKFPNFYMMYGPNTNLGHNSIIIMSEAQANYISQALKYLETTQFKSLEVRSDVMTAYHRKIQERLKSMIWNSIDKSWYKSADGGNPNNWPGRTMEYIRKLRRFKLENYESN